MILVYHYCFKIWWSLNEKGPTQGRTVVAMSQQELIIRPLFLVVLVLYLGLVEWYWTYSTSSTKTKVFLVDFVALPIDEWMQQEVSCFLEALGWFVARLFLIFGLNLAKMLQCFSIFGENSRWSDGTSNQNRNLSLYKNRCDGKMSRIFQHSEYPGLPSNMNFKFIHPWWLYMILRCVFFARNAAFLICV